MLNLVRWHGMAVALESFALTRRRVAADEAKRYTIDRGVIVKTPEGATPTADVVRAKGVMAPQPVVLRFTIYADPPFHMRELKGTADHGYVAVMAYARGKYSSADEIRPWETETRDTRAVIDWASKQAWCNGKVGMYGLSYDAFAQWAALKSRTPR